MDAIEEAQSKSNGVVTKLLLVKGPLLAVPPEYRFKRLLLAVMVELVDGVAELRYNPVWDIFVGGAGSMAWLR